LQLGDEGSALPAPAPCLSLRPLGAGGCGSGVQLLTESNFDELKIFSDFLEKNNVRDVKTQFQRRLKKKDKRGGTFMAFWPKNYDELRVQVEKAASLGFEVTAIVDGLLLVDDLSEITLAEFLLEGYKAAVIETSRGNYQVLVATASGWSDDQIRATQRALARRFGGDANATGNRQPHRLPGSLNRKEGGCFVACLHSVQEGRLIEPAPVEAGELIKTTPGRLAQHRGDTGTDNTPSGQDFGRACELLAKGQPEQIVIGDIADRAASRGRHGDHGQYADRTVKNAILHFQK
jgi:RepB DNA-primase from phage plasmid